MSVSIQSAAATDNSALCSLTSSHTRSHIIAAHCFHDADIHFMNRLNACAASSWNSLVNSAVDTPATSANFATSADHVATSLFIVSSAFWTADHHTSASTHTLENAAPIPAISAALSHTTAPAPAILLANCVISLSVVAKLLPSATTADQNLSTSLNGSCSTLNIFANASLAASLVRFDDTDIRAIVSVNFSISFVATHN